MKGTKESWGIVGGGLLGMTLAHRLAQQGAKVTLLEAENQLGGLASSHQLGDMTLDRFYHVILMSDGHLRSLLKELALEQEVNWVETKTGFYTDGKLYSLSNTIEFLRFPPLKLFDKMRLGATILRASQLKDWRCLENTMVENWLKKWSGEHTFKKIWLPLLRAKLGEAYRQTSAAFIWATINRMYAARRSGFKKEMFGYIPGGYTRILQQFAEKLKQEQVTIKLNHKIQKVMPLDHDRVRIESDHGEGATFHKVILTIPSPYINTMVPDLSNDEQNRHRAIQYLGVVCLSLLLKRPVSNFYVTNITDTGIPFTGIIEMSALVDRLYFNGNSLLYLPKYVTLDDPIFLLSDNDIEKKFIQALQKIYPDLDTREIVGRRVSREQYVFALPSLNYSQCLPPVRASIPGLFIVNSAHIVNGTLNVNETIQLAEKTVNRILASGSNNN